MHCSASPAACPEYLPGMLGMLTQADFHMFDSTLYTLHSTHLTLHFTHLTLHSTQVRPCVAPYSLQLKINDCLQLQGPAALAILSLQHLPECQRRFAPLGVISCSDVCAGAQAKLAPGLQPHHHLFLDLTKVSIACTTCSWTSQRSAQRIALHYNALLGTALWR